MRFDEEYNSKNDYFDGPDIPDKPVEEQEEKRPRLDPEDPDYWEQPESEWEHLKPVRKKRLWVWVALTGIGLGLIVAIYLRWWSPYVEGASQVGYIEGIEKRGTVFKTFEGVMLPYKELKDTTRVYKQDLHFSVADAAMAVTLKRMQYANRPVRIEYSRYHATLPWRGDERIVVTKVDSVDPRNILPPEYRPELP